MSLNLRKRFTDLLPKDPLLVGRVLSVGEQSSVVEFPQGGRATVQGVGVEEGSRAFVQSGRIQGPAPDLETHEITV